MHIKKNASIVEFLRAVNTCGADVLFATQEGDILNLKSQLSRFVFATVASNEDMLYSAEIICKSDEERLILAAYLEE